MNNHRVFAETPPSGIVGIGSSAGGLVALENFLSNVPPDSGLAYVIVQHQAPGRDSLLLPLLQRHTKLPVRQAQDGLAVQANHVYLNLPDQDLALLQGVLHLLPPVEPPGLPAPIDFFFVSLATDQRQRSMGVVLSGLGSDGTAGLRAIRQAGGACFVQAPENSQFAAMPRSAIDAGLADAVDSAAQLPERILAHAQGRQRAGHTGIPPEHLFLDKIIVLLRDQTGHDFSPYKKDFLLQRLSQRMGQHQLIALPSYLRYLRETPKEATLLAAELLIGVTRFFRDAPALEQLKSDIFPALLACHPEGGVLRAWVPGCASAEEAYSLAMVFLETLDAVQPSEAFSLQIFATDLDANSLAIGRTGIYERRIAQEVSAARLQRFFVKSGPGYRVCDELRAMVTFAQHNLLTDPPLARMDLISCCNVLIYLQTELQPRLMATLHYSLNNTSFLLLGSTESVGSATDLFAQVSSRSRLYRRLNAPKRSTSPHFPSRWLPLPGPGGAAGTQPVATPEPARLKLLMEQLLLQRFAPAALLATRSGDVRYINGDLSHYIELGSGEPCMNLFVIVRDSLKLALREAFHRALRLGTVTSMQRVPVSEVAGLWVTVTIDPLQTPPTPQWPGDLLLVLFAPVVTPTYNAGDPEQTLFDSREGHLFTLGQQLQISQSELKLARQELQYAQEALQASQEESQTALESQTITAQEYRSLNTELAAFNSELQFKLTDLTRAHQELTRLLDSSGIASLSLDAKFHVRSFNAAISQVIKLLVGDQGRPITDIASNLDYPDLLVDAREVLRTLLPHECERPTHDGRRFRVHIMPSGSASMRADGVVITFLNISAKKNQPQGDEDGLS